MSEVVLREQLMEIGQELANKISAGVKDLGHEQQRVCTQAFLVTKEIVYTEDNEYTDVNWLKAGSAAGWETRAMVEEAIRQAEEQVLFLIEQAEEED